MDSEVNMFERFTEQSRLIIVEAQHEARRMRHNFVGTEQILLGILADGENEAAMALSDVEIRLKAARQEVKQIIGLGSGTPDGEVPFTPRAKLALDAAIEEAEKLSGKDTPVEPRHLLVGLMHQSEGVAAVVIRKLATPSDDILQSFYRSFNRAA
ncbi:MAG: Clp protease N-terminal domain-containing protein [Cyanobacteria bacterium P01_A01_bin.114]